MPEITQTNSDITFLNRWDHFLARWGIGRGKHWVRPGLYSLGNPDEDSPVYVTANYTLSFDALRWALKDMECYILVILTYAINVWCAAGKGTFGTEELLNRIKKTELADVVKHRRLILPQLGAPGVSAHEVKSRSGFRVEYGPVRAKDLPAYMEAGKATPAMRRVTFPLLDRMVLIPMEFVHAFIPMITIATLIFVLCGGLSALAVIAAFLGGTVIFPILLPYLPTKEFTSKGLILGSAIALVFAVVAWQSYAANAIYWRIGAVAAYLLAMPPVTAYYALNFTGSSTYTSRSGVRREMYYFIPKIAWMLGIGVAITLTLLITRVFGG